MKLSEIGEFGFIDRLSEKFKNISIPHSVGIGDDCAIIPCDENNDYIITTDLLIENIHFIRSKISPFDLGYKTLAVNLSDVAAMGAKPVGSFLSIAIPSSVEVEYLDRLIDGYHHLSEKHNVALLGGDTTRAQNSLTLNVTAIGIIEKNKARLRSMAQEGDIICVTGFLGDSAGGLKIILEDLPATETSGYLVRRHNCPQPAVDEGIWLAQQKGVNAMMDISDGIASDLKHILKASKKSAFIDLDKLPISNQLREISNQYNFDSVELATSGGEDYRLLITINKNRFDEIAKTYKVKFSSELHAIGTIKKETEEIITWTKNGNPVSELKGGFNHFEIM